MRLAIFAAVAVAAASPAFAGTTIFSDSDLTLSDYTVTTKLPSAAFTAEVYQGGDPDGGTSFATYYTTTGPSKPSPRFWALGDSFVYDPSADGAIETIDAAMDQVVAVIYENKAVSLFDTKLDIRILAEQGGQLYRSRSVTTANAVYNTWVSSAVAGLTAADFLRIDPDNPFVAPTEHGLDFSGDAIRFGFEVAPFAVTVNGGASTGTTTSYLWIDDFKLTLNTRDRMGAVPEPATWAMMILGFGAVGVAARRRRPAVA